ncbi:hypothetical protein [Helicobacter sp. 10-6591]|uniref:hypothetical protein n=1 Tax=Helicobacter sp. 10-6591 TaxID=2004998 RepID=UPI000DCB774B|nr:hypothetical protein [Helicobacter sp. 10-6591]RAX56281.1 hypothetical protein CCY97_00290 [Helicobacter sp. 10-6591]
MKKTNFFYFGLSCCLLGWAFIGFGFILFPLSLFFVLASRVVNIAFWAIIVSDIVGFSTSLYLIAHRIYSQL